MVASFTMNEAYFRECLGEWIGSVSKWRKLEPLLCVLFAFAGVVTVLQLGRPGRTQARGHT